MISLVAVSSTTSGTSIPSGDPPWWINQHWNTYQPQPYVPAPSVDADFTKAMIQMDVRAEMDKLRAELAQEIQLIVERERATNRKEMAEEFRKVLKAIAKEYETSKSPTERRVAAAISRVLAERKEPDGNTSKG